jgi:ABC-2 type transport system ATP-binding protein
MASAVLQIRGLAKSYRIGLLGRKRRRGLEPLDLELPAGEVLGYLGPNGSGKTTTLKLLMGLIFPDSGEATVLGSELANPDWRRRVGYLPEHPYFYDYLTPREYLDYAGRLFELDRETRRERSEGLLERLELSAAADVPLRRLSKGMQQRLGLAQALINEPELVFLDEPMSGLDPLGRARVRDLIQSLRDAGRSVFFSTHILPDAESLCDRVALLRGGRLLNVGPLDEILDVAVSHLEVLATGAESLRARPPEGVLQARELGERWYLEVEEAALGRVVAALEQAGGRVRSVLPKRLSLEEFFVREMREPAKP